MTSENFPALVVRKPNGGDATAVIESISSDQLPPGEVTVRVAWSSLNYKDALALEGHPGVVGNFPHVPGIDLAGEVAASDDPRFSPGDPVLATGYGLGERHWGGFSLFCRLPAEHVVPLPTSLSPEDAMVYGTAGFTAGLCVTAIQDHGIEPSDGDVLVTGSSGGVGSIAVAILARLGYRVVAVTGKTEAHELLRYLGAAEIVGRDEVSDDSGPPMLKARWAAAVDTVGGATLSTVLRSTRRHGCVAACGLVGGDRIEPLTVYPFILRGVTLAGIDSVECPMDRRVDVWQKLAGEWRVDLDAIRTVISLEEVIDYAQRIKRGGLMGRTVVKVG